MASLHVALEEEGEVEDDLPLGVAKVEGDTCPYPVLDVDAVRDRECVGIDHCSLLGSTERPSEPCLPATLLRWPPAPPRLLPR